MSDENLSADEPMSFGQVMEILARHQIATGQQFDGTEDTDEINRSTWFKDAVAATAKDWAERLERGEK